MTTQATHTPGPWSVSFGEHEASIYTSGTIASVDDTMTGWKANARLIAALPDLLRALEIVAAGNTDPDDMVEIAAEALRKVEGEQ